MCIMRQRNKVERFKDNFSPFDSIHAKFDVASGLPVSVGIASAVAGVVQSGFEKYMSAAAVVASVALHTFGLVRQSIWATLVEVEGLKREKGQRPYRS